VQILGISSNNPFSQKTFADSLQLPYPLLSDFPNLTVIQSYGGLNRQWDMTTAQRFFFLIDQAGIVGENGVDRPRNFSQANQS
jgi:peroxiredoxin